MPFPAPGSYPVQFENYVLKVEEDSILDALQAQQSIVDHFFYDIPTQKHDYAYAAGKWTLKELLQHLIDTERIFQFRALSFARGEKQGLPAFDENEYASESGACKRNWNDLCEELKTVRRSSIQLFESFSTDMLLQSGMANNKSCTCLAMGYCIAGHILHHKKIIEERYL